MSTKKLFKLSLLCAAVAASSAALAAYPDKAITMIVPFAPGGNLDITARAIAPALSKALGGTSVVVENKPGAGGSIGAGYVARTAPDGYTLLVSTPNAIAVTPFMTKTPYTLKSFRSIGLVAHTPLLIDVNGKSKYKTIQELMKYACANPGKVTVGHSGIGTTNYLGLISLEEASHCKFSAIPYKGSGPALVDLLGNQIDMVVDQLSSSAAQIHSGNLKALAVMTAERVSDLPNVPTLQEAGIKGVDASTNTGLLVPAKTPDAVVKTLNEALQKVAQDPSVRNVLGKVGSSAISSTPQKFMGMIEEESKVAAKLSAEGKLKK
jgi:tripartite-type tricarboxylate transporter receptor subunit TctC